MISKLPFTIDVTWQEPEQAEGNITGYKVTCLQKGEESSKAKITGKLQYLQNNVQCEKVSKNTRPRFNPKSLKIEKINHIVGFSG